MQHSQVVPSAVKDTAVDQAMDRAIAHLRSRQLETGALPGDYGGPMFLLPMYVGTCYGLGIELDEPTRAGMARYLANTQREDGSWGLHVEGEGHVFTTALNYVAWRLLGAGPDESSLQQARLWLHAHGDARAAAPWGKFFLSLLGLHEYEGMNPVPPELWLLPYGVPVNPARMWCHTRMVYLPMSYLYGHRVQRPLDDTLRALREELYDEPYERIDWAASRNHVYEGDAYRPTSQVMNAVNRVLLQHERKPLLRERALSEVLEQVRREDRNTDYVCLGPISKLFHMWVWDHASPGGEEFQRHLERLPEYLYEGDDGIKMQGYHSSQLWDTSFAAQAVVDAGRAEQEQAFLAEAHRFVDAAQVLQDVVDRKRCYRDPTAGGWGFSDRTNGWVVSDCTAEGLKAALKLASVVSDPIARPRLEAAVDLLLWMQTDDGGWASYEPPRGPAWLEALNPSNCFGDIMIDYSYVECTASSIEALTAFREQYPGARDEEIAAAVARGRDYLLARQRSDGSFEGSWGVCFTYGTWFGIAGLRAAGLGSDHPAVQAACRFLQSKQLADGGWGELAEGNRTLQYVHADAGSAVQTSWALLGLIEGGLRDSDAVQRGVRFLLEQQREDGRWDHGPISGMFNKTCGIHYDNYARVFPLWALARGA